jgi:hypothetical protein
MVSAKEAGLGHSDAWERGVTESGFVMGCPRCHNLMVEETFVDLEASPSVWSFTGWRCVSCGEILDSIILQNRTRHPEPQRRRARW